jgi:hypothetical protein
MCVCWVSIVDQTRVPCCACLFLMYTRPQQYTHTRGCAVVWRSVHHSPYGVIMAGQPLRGLYEFRAGAALLAALLVWCGWQRHMACNQHFAGTTAALPLICPLLQVVCV